MLALIMAGGAGTRFWPLSRTRYPKQFLRVVENKSMIRLTVDRLLKKIPIERIFIVTAAEQVELICEHIPELDVQNIIVEPFGMNTAPCIALSISYMRRLYHDGETVMVLPSDHVIQQDDLFQQSMEMAEQPAQQGNLITFGIVPRYPATGYGYIEAGDAYDAQSYHVLRFKEKPDLETAKTFLEQGGFYWNSGMFYWKLSTIYDAYRTLMPELFEVLNGIEQQWNREGLDADISELYARMPRKPVDIGIMEKANQRLVIPVHFDWSDVGSWRALADITPADTDGNSIPAEHYCIQSRDNYIYTNKFTALIGLEGLVVVETEDAILIAKKEDAEEVKKVVEHLQAGKRTELL